MTTRAPVPASSSRQRGNGRLEVEDALEQFAALIDEQNRQYAALYRVHFRLKVLAGALAGCGLILAAQHLT